MKNIRWAMGGYITFVHILGLYGLFYVPQCKAATLWWAFVLWPITGFGITGGAHRLWAHRSYTAKPLYRCIVMLMNSCANQGSIWHWARDHRTHHFHSETVADPHDAIRGFVFAHIGWLYLKKDKRVAEAGNMVNMDDLREDGFVMWQKKYDPWWNLFWCFGMPAFVASRMWGERFMNAFMVAGALRYLWVLHCTVSVRCTHDTISSPFVMRDSHILSSLVLLFCSACFCAVARQFRRPSLGREAIRPEVQPGGEPSRSDRLDWGGLA